MKRLIKKQLHVQRKRALRELAQSESAKNLLKSLGVWEEYKKNHISDIRIMAVDK